MKIIISPTCNNSPKNQQLLDLTIGFSDYNLEAIEEFLDENIQWTLLGESPIVGRDFFLEELNKHSENPAIQITIHHAITHGKSGAVNGEMVMKDGNRFAFADFYEFTSASAKKVAEIKSYIVAL